MSDEGLDMPANSRLKHPAIMNSEFSRHEIEQQIDALARKYGRTHEKEVLKQILQLCWRLEGLETTESPVNEITPASLSLPNHSTNTHQTFL